MLTQFHPTAHLTVGLTLRDETRPESHNIALHSCVSPDAVLENRHQLAAELGVPLSQFVLANQTHSANFYEVTKDDWGRGATSLETAIPNTDALFSYEPNTVLGVFTADCVPLLLWSEQSGLIAAVHSGWQGTVKEIVPKLLTHLIEKKGEDPNHLHAYIGHCLSQDLFEVDADVAQKYQELGYTDDWIKYREETGKYHIDNGATVKEQCLRAGVLEAHIEQTAICTFTSERGFSYRQDKQAGRHLGFIFRT